MSKKLAIVFMCLIAISAVIEFTFKQSAFAHIIASAIPVTFLVYIITHKDFKTKYPKAAELRPQIVILLIVLIALTLYQYVIK